MIQTTLLAIIALLTGYQAYITYKDETRFSYFSDDSHWYDEDFETPTTELPTVDLEADTPKLSKTVNKSKKSK